MFRKKTPPKIEPFTRIMPSRWLAEYSGILPHSSKQSAAIVHHLFCCRVDDQSKKRLLAAGVNSTGRANATHVVWCVCFLSKDNGTARMLFRNYLDLSLVQGTNWQDWVVFTTVRHLSLELKASSNFRYLLPCKSKREYPWCAVDVDLANYWESEITSWVKGSISFLKKQ